MNTFELHIAVYPRLIMPRARHRKPYTSSAEYDEIMLNAYDIIERIESGDVNLGVSGFRVCIDGICYVRCNFEGIGKFMIIHAYRTTDNIVEINRIDTYNRTNVYTSAFRACMLNIDHAIKLIKLRLINITSYVAINGVYNSVEYYNSTLPRFEPTVARSRTRCLIKYIIAARMYVDGMSIKEISEILNYDFGREMKLITE